MFTEVVDMHFVTNARIVYSLLLAYETTSKKNIFFFQYVLLDVQTPHSIDCMMIVIFDLVFFQFFVETKHVSAWCLLRHDSLSFTMIHILVLTVN